MWRRTARHGWDRRRWGARSERRYRIMQRTYHVLLAYVAVDLLARWMVELGAPEWLRDTARVTGTVLILVLIGIEVVTQWHEPHDNESGPNR